MRKLLTSLIAALVLAAGLSAPAVAAPAAPSAVSVEIQVAKAAKPCKAKKKPGKNYWVCVTPGSYCPKAARKKYGYAYKTMKRYRCSKYPNGQWRWKRA